MSAPRRKRKKSTSKGRFHEAMGAIDRWTLPSLPADVPWKKYMAVLGASLLGGLIVFGGMSALISQATQTKNSEASVTSTKSTAENKHSTSSTKSHQQKTATKEITPSRPQQVSGTAFVSGSNAAIRERPAINAKIIERAVFGSNVELITQEGKWVQVRSTGQNISGWIEKAYLSF